jgi:hypothetical protein
MTVGTDKIMRRNLQGVTVATLIILLALAILVVAVFDQKWYVGIYVVLIGLGIVLIATSFVLPGEKNALGPTYSDMRLVWGVLLAMGGFIGMVNTYVSGELWVAAVLILLTFGILILIMTMKGILKIKR